MTKSEFELREIPADSPAVLVAPEYQIGAWSSHEHLAGCNAQPSLISAAAKSNRCGHGYYDVQVRIPAIQV